MRQHLLYHIYARSSLDLQRTEGVPTPVKSDILGYARILQPTPQRCLCHVVLKSGKYQPCSSLTDKFKSLVTYRVVHKVFGLLHADGDIHAAVTVWLYVLPCEVADVALA